MDCRASHGGLDDDLRPQATCPDPRASYHESRLGVGQRLKAVPHGQNADAPLADPEVVAAVHFHVARDVQRSPR